MALMNALSAPASPSVTAGPPAMTANPNPANSPSGSGTPRFDEALQQARQPTARNPQASGGARSEPDAPSGGPADGTDAEAAAAGDADAGAQTLEEGAAAARQARAAARLRLRLEAGAAQAASGAKAPSGTDARLAAGDARADAAARAMATEAGVAQRWAAALRGQPAGESSSPRMATLADPETAGGPASLADQKDTKAARTLTPDAPAATQEGPINPSLMPIAVDAPAAAAGGASPPDGEGAAVTGLTAAADSASTSWAVAADARGVDTRPASSAATGEAITTAGKDTVLPAVGLDANHRAPTGSPAQAAASAATGIDGESARSTQIGLSAEAGSRKAQGGGLSTELSAVSDGMRLLGAWSAGGSVLAADAAGVVTPAQPTGAATDHPGPAGLLQDTLDTPMDSPAFSGALGARIAWLARDGLERAQLNVHPAELGPVQVQLSMDGNQVRVDLTADASATRQVLEQSLPSLASALRDAGFTLAGGGVFQQSQDRPGQPGGAPEPTGGSRRADIDAPVGAVGPVTPVGRRQGLVDLFA